MRLCFFEKFLILLVFTELNILFSENYPIKNSIKNSKCGEKNLNFYQFVKRSKNQIFVKLK